MRRRDQPAMKVARTLGSIIGVGILVGVTLAVALVILWLLRALTGVLS